MSLELKVGGRAVSVDVVPPVNNELERVIGDKVKANRDSEDSEDSFFVADIGRVMDLYDFWKESFPDIHPFYAVKCNSDPVLLKLLASLGTGFDCATKNEIQMALDAGVSPDHIVFNNPFKEISHLKFAAREGVKLMSVNCEMELQKVKQYHPSAQLLLRITPGKLDDYSIGKMEGIKFKFGCNVDGAKTLLDKAKALELDVVGISFHLGIGVDGVNCSSSSSYLASLQLSDEIMCYAEKLGFRFSVLDIGGGFAGLPYLQDTVRELSVSLNKGVRELMGKYRHLTRVIAEPGRFFCCSVYTIAVCVICKKEAEEDGSMIYVLSDGKYNSFNPKSYFPQFPLTPVPLNKKRPVVPNGNKSVYLWGPVCAADLVGRSSTNELPELDHGDWLFFENMGAYSMMMWMPFNGFPKPEVHYFVKEAKRLEAERRFIK